ncbi:hypothetical protein FJZ55_10290, partial [Candidatus Woesearchaeota archaeon]|nr:hypothetical protein [Candidatus Woesearchaeota archaeon]
MDLSVVEERALEAIETVRDKSPPGAQLRLDWVIDKAVSEAKTDDLDERSRTLLRQVVQDLIEHNVKRESIKAGLAPDPDWRQPTAALSEGGSQPGVLKWISFTWRPLESIGLAARALARTEPREPSGPTAVASAASTANVIIAFPPAAGTAPSAPPPPPAPSSAQELPTRPPEGPAGPPTTRFPTPPGVTWADVLIRSVDADTVLVRAGNASGRYNFAELGCVDRRTGKPDAQWEALQTVIAMRGEITWEKQGSSRRLPHRLRRLAEALQLFLGFPTRPFKYDEELQGWKVL